MMQRSERGRRPPPVPKNPCAGGGGGGESSSVVSGMTSIGTTPRSIALAAYPLVRDLSDLSGSCIGSLSVSRGQHQEVTTSIDAIDASLASSSDRPWAQAKILSSKQPQHPQPPTDCNDSIAFVRKRLRDPQVVYETEDEDDACRSCASEREDRVPVLVLLMNPATKQFELMQIWVDLAEDTVNCLMKTIRNSIINNAEWNQDFDGIFQVRNNQFSQLINILHLSKYQVRPNEMLVAKPSSMLGGAAITYATGLVSYLKGMGIVRWISSENAMRSAKAPEEAFLVLTQEARSRIYIPGETLKHYQAYQFLSFSRTFEPVVNVPSEQDEDEYSLRRGGISVGSVGLLRQKQRPTQILVKALQDQNRPGPCHQGSDDGQDPVSAGMEITVCKYRGGLDRGNSNKTLVKTRARSFQRVRRLLSSLNCASGNYNTDEDSDQDNNSIGVTVTAADSSAASEPWGDLAIGRLNRVWEEECSLAAASVRCESAPLLHLSTRTTSDK
jgi:hypothetical protein